MRTNIFARLGATESGEWRVSGGLGVKKDTL